MERHSQACQIAARGVRDELLFRRVSDEEWRALSWRSQTTAAEFERIMLWLWQARLLRFSDQERKWASVSLQCCLPETDQLARTEGDQTSPLRSHLQLPDARGRANGELLDWLRTYFVGEGFEWRENDWGKRHFRNLRAREPRLRAFVELRSVYWEVRLSHQPEPSFHQQLEARLELRAWLRDQVSENQIDQWLTPPESL